MNVCICVCVWCTHTHQLLLLVSDTSFYFWPSLLTLKCLETAESGLIQISVLSPKGHTRAGRSWGARQGVCPVGFQSCSLWCLG